MMRTPKRILTLAILVLGGLALQAGAALACTCGCAYTQNTCGLSASGIKADVQQADLAFLQPAGDGAVCPAAASGDVAR